MSCAIDPGTKAAARLTAARDERGIVSGESGEHEPGLVITKYFSNQFP